MPAARLQTPSPAQAAAPPSGRMMQRRSAAESERVEEAPEHEPQARAGDLEFSRARVHTAGAVHAGGATYTRGRGVFTPLAEFPHRQRIAEALGVEDFNPPAVVDPSLRALGAEAAEENGAVRFARTSPGLEVAAHEAAHVLQGRGGGAGTDRAGAERHAAAVAARVRSGRSAADLAGPGLVSAAVRGPLFFRPTGSPPVTHTVKAGESLWAISKQYYGDGKYTDAIRLANPATVTLKADGTPIINPGDVLSLPDTPDAADPWANPEISPLLRNGGAWTQAQTTATLWAYYLEPVANRDAMVARYIGYGNLGAMLTALPKLSTQPGGTWEQAARDLLQRIQRVGAKADAAKQGLSSEAAMAKAQAKEMTKRNTAAASAALGGGTPTTAQVAAQQSTQVAVGSIAPQGGTLTVADEARIDTDLTTKAIPGFITWATANEPGLGLKATQFRAATRELFDRGQDIIAAADNHATPRVMVGETFLELVNADPAYALGTVVHELWGHNTYEGIGKYGDPGSAYGLDLYDQASALMPGYTAPAAGTADRQSEIDNYGYHETEMYSLMREVPYYKANAPAHAALTANFDPGPAVKGRIKDIKDAYEAKVARALVRGLYLRFLADPTVGGPAMNAFRDGVKAIFSAKDAAAILK